MEPDFVDKVIACINIFVIPMISLYIYNKVEQKSCAFDIRQLGLYSVFTILLLFFGNLFRTAISIITNTDCSFYSFFYLTVSMVLSLLMPFLLKIIKNNIRIIVKYEEK